jgi:hypothetical protein
MKNYTVILTIAVVAGLALAPFNQAWATASTKTHLTPGQSLTLTTGTHYHAACTALPPTGGGSASCTVQIIPGQPAQPGPDGKMGTADDIAAVPERKCITCVAGEFDIVY